jgi:hypothetical protein
LLADIDAVTLQRTRSVNSRTKELVEEVVRCRSSALRRPLDEVVSDPTGYGTHAAVVDHQRATEVGLQVEYTSHHTDEAWQIVWDLHTKYQVLQMREGRPLSMVEGRRVSLIG